MSTTLSNQLFHGIRALTTTVGTGDLTLVSDTSYMKPLARVSVDTPLSYSILDGSSREWGIGTVKAADVFERTTITGTEVNGVYTSGGTALDLSGGVTIFECTLHEATVLALFSAINHWSASQVGDYVALTSTSNSIAVNLSLSNNFKHTFTEDSTLAAPSGVIAGQSGIIEFTQHASSPKVLTLNSFWKWRSGTPPSPVVTATNSAKDVMAYIVDSTGTFASCTMQNAVA